MDLHALLEGLYVPLIVLEGVTDGFLEVIYHRKVGKERQNMFHLERARPLRVAYPCMHASATCMQPPHPLDTSHHQSLGAHTRGMGMRVSVCECTSMAVTRTNVRGRRGVATGWMERRKETRQTEMRQEHQGTQRYRQDKGKENSLQGRESACSLSSGAYREEPWQPAHRPCLAPRMSLS